MRTLTYEKDGITYKTLAEAPKGAQVVLTRDTEPYTATNTAEKRRKAIRTKTVYADYKTPGTN